MEEKKLTDEQKSMYELNVYRNRYYAEPQGTEKAIIANAINDLFNVINCLHERNAGLNDKNATLEYENSELKQRVSILEADNDDYKDKIAENELVSIDWHNEQVGHLEEEIERLTKERNEYKGLYETMYRKWSDLSTKDLNCEKSKEIAREYLNKNAELQKQVDELKVSLADTIKRNEELIEENEQAVKYTAKEIEGKIQDLLSTPFIGKTETQKYIRKGMEDGLKMVLEIVRECKGVEVE